MAVSIMLQLLPLLLACSDPPEPTPATAVAAVRPAGDLLVIGGELGFDSHWDDIFEDGGTRRNEARRPLDAARPALVGRLDSNQSVTFVPLSSGIADDDCDGAGCAGAAELAWALPQAGVDAVSLVSPAIERQGSAAATAELLAERGVCSTGHQGSAPCIHQSGQTAVALVSMSARRQDEQASATETAKSLVQGVADKADVVVLFVAVKAGGAERRGRRDLVEKLAAESGASVVVSHFDGGFGGVDQVGDTFVIHNPGAMVSREAPVAGLKWAWTWQLHLVDKKVAWAEGIPLLVQAGRTVRADDKQRRLAVQTLEKRSDAPGLVFEGRAPIVEF